MKRRIINIKKYNSKMYDEVYNKLNDHDKAKIIKMPKNRVVHFILGRYLMIKEGLDINKITYNEHRKPLLDDAYFSISHSEEYTILVIDDSPIGVDMEHIRHIDSSLKKTFMKSDVSDLEFLKYMTRQESYIKINGYGLASFDGDSSEYKFNTFKYKDYLITICKRK